MLTARNIPVSGMTRAVFGSGLGTATAWGPPPNLFGELVAVHQAHSRLSAELKSVRAKLTRARAYLDAPGNNPALAEAYVSLLKARHSAALTRLRANRVQARALLARLDGPTAA